MAGQLLILFFFFLPCQERWCGLRGLWRVQRADTRGACSCRCCNQTYPCPVCPGLSSSPTGHLEAEKQGLSLNVDSKYTLKLEIFVIYLTTDDFQKHVSPRKWLNCMDLKVYLKRDIWFGIISIRIKYGKRQQC